MWRNVTIASHPVQPYAKLMLMLRISSLFLWWSSARPFLEPWLWRKSSDSLIKQIHQRTLAMSIGQTCPNDCLHISVWIRFWIRRKYKPHRFYKLKKKENIAFSEVTSSPSSHSSAALPTSTCQTMTTSSVAAFLFYLHFRWHEN